MAMTKHSAANRETYLCKSDGSRIRHLIPPPYITDSLAVPPESGTGQVQFKIQSNQSPAFSSKTLFGGRFFCYDEGVMFSFRAESSPSIEGLFYPHGAGFCLA